MKKIVLPIVVNSEEQKIAEMIGRHPEYFEIQPAYFYQIENVKPYYDFTNLCTVSSGGIDYLVALSMDDVDKQIQAANFKLNLN